MNSHAVGILTGLLLLLLTTASSSQSAADWSRAAQATGCQMIVWEREQSECISRQSDAKVACERQDLSCADLSSTQYLVSASGQFETLIVQKATASAMRLTKLSGRLARLTRRFVEPKARPPAERT